ncbi:hypothetical protein AXE80_10850 [Wenyingzhuangia fucanilytica]|uniref:Phage terminase large subunit N-terminal domain-containing protein n=1 Tax=Wenyingzhuangia fucanilytica TaxID=1790137 RepID=A0A1B1Y7I8_9FLAO|nr:hypothetical protein [Wenyingzhuangia fucanilytica]ANW96742.1 hypothetical protein AXE80_10850 [Wenyingzhuangia fucanilytica]
MSRKTKINTDEDGLKLHFANVLSVVIEMLQPKFLYIIVGRGGAKTTEILCRRFIRVFTEMPGCYVALVGDTYMNLMKNVVPSLLEGFERMGFVEDIHYVVGKRPPSHFKKPYKNPQNWKHTITWHTGAHVKLVSMDRPSTGAGDSYQHLGGDEVKYIPEKKINKLTPAIRGEHVRFQNSPLYRGRSFTTDMPNPNHREHDWIKGMKKNMNKEQLKLMWECANVLNEIRIEHYHATKQNNPKAIRNKKRLLDRWQASFDKIRKDSTFYYEGSSYVNADVLTESFFKDLLDTMDFREVKTSVLSIEPKLEKGQMFYPNLTAKNFYKDSYNWSFYDKQELTSGGIIQTSLGLKHIQHNQPLEVGLDPGGNMCSLAIGQSEGNEVYRVLKFMYVLSPEYLPELGAKFRTYFANHQKKEVLAWCDRKANAYQNVGEDEASKFKKAIEFDADGIATDWTCTIMTRHQGTIYHQQEYELMLYMCNGTNGLPLLKLPDNDEGKELKSSLEKAQTIIKENKEGKKTIHKLKTSEKLALHRLPLESTNPSDALKYLVCKEEHLNKIKGVFSKPFSNALDLG